MKLNNRFLFLFISIVLSFLFIFFSYLVGKDVFIGLDFDTTVRFQDKISHQLDLPFSLFSLIGSTEFTLAFILIIFSGLFVTQKHLFIGIFLFFFIFFIELLGKLLIFHPGPPYMFFRYAIGFSFPSSYIHTNYSYPSGHMARTAFLVVILFFLTFKYIKHKYFKWLLLISYFLFAVIMFISRVYLGEHWLSDVIGGLLLGMSIAGLSIAIW